MTAIRCFSSGHAQSHNQGLPECAWTCARCSKHAPMFADVHSCYSMLCQTSQGIDKAGFGYKPTRGISVKLAGFFAEVATGFIILMLSSEHVVK